MAVLVYARYVAAVAVRYIASDARWRRSAAPVLDGLGEQRRSVVPAARSDLDRDRLVASV